MRLKLCVSLAGSGKTVLMYGSNDQYKPRTGLTFFRSSTIHTLAVETLKADITLPLASSHDLTRGKIISRELAVIYHYCEFSDPQSLEPTTILGTLIRQLLETVAIPEALGEQIERCFEPRGREATPEELLDIFKHALLRFSKIYVLVDGLDECKTADIVLLLRMFQLLLLPETGRPSLKIIIFSRHTEAISRLLTSCPHLEISVEKISLDINRFIEDTVRSKISCGDLEITDELLEKEVIKTLKAGAHGM